MDYIANYIEEIQLSGELKELKDKCDEELGKTKDAKHWMEIVAEKFDVHPDVVSITYYEMITGNKYPKFLKSRRAEEKEEKRKEKEKSEAWMKRMQDSVDNMSEKEKEEFKERVNTAIEMIDKFLKDF